MIKKNVGGDNNWPYHKDAHGNMVKCASNPCRIHHGEDVMAANLQDAYEKQAELESKQAVVGLNDASHASTTAVKTPAKGSVDASFEDIISHFDDVSYEDAEKASENVKSVDVDAFIRDSVDDRGFIRDSWKNEEERNRFLDSKIAISSHTLSDAEQDSLLSLSENKKYMDAAVKSVDYDTLPAATETINDLADNPSTSSESLRRITDIALARRNNSNFVQQVYVAAIANHPNLSHKDASRLYKAYPEECMKAQRFDKDIINSALKNPTTPDRVRAIAITNPRATVDAMETAIKDGGDAFRAQAMLNPNGQYLNAAHRERSRKIDAGYFDDDELKMAERFRKRVSDRIGIPA